MKNEHKPKYPVYVISKGRFKGNLTAKFLIEDKVDFHLVVEPQEAEEYKSRYGKHRVLVLPFSNLGKGSIPARNWVWEHSIKAGAKRHWILDDNIAMIRRLHHQKRIRCNANNALRACEDFTDRYENIGIAGLNYTFFAVNKLSPFVLNVHVYSTLLIKNDLPYRWRGKYNEDTDLCLQVLSGKWCTILINAFLIDKAATMTVKGGNFTELYKGDGRLNMANSLKRLWPKVVDVHRRFGRPQHKIKKQWAYFDTPLIKKKDIEISKEPNNYGLKLKAMDQVKSKELQKLVQQYNSNQE